MKVLVECCAECPFKKVSAEIKCKLKGLTLMGADGIPDHVSARTVHPECPLILGRVVVTLDTHARRGAGGAPEAFLGNRVQLANKMKGVVVAKFKNADDAKIPPHMRTGLSQADLKGAWYLVLYDGHETTLAAALSITDIIRDQSDYNYNKDFEFYFGFGEGDDEK